MLPKGPYICELPGDAGDPGIAAGRHQPGDDFEVIGDSSYRAAGERGVYLLVGDRLTMTSGALAGRRFHRAGPSFVRALQADGSDGDLRCIRSLQTIGLAPDDGKLARCKREGKQSADRALALGARKPHRDC